MTKQEILMTINKNPVFYLATVENGEPRVRGMLLYKADEDDILFHTGKMRDLYKQVISNPKAELCFNSGGVQIRLRGELELIEDNVIKEEIAAHPSRTFLKGWRDSITHEAFLEAFAVFKLKNAVAFTWRMDENFAEKEYIQL